MIKIDYSNGQIKIMTEKISDVFLSNQLPLRFDIKKTISKEIVWSTKLHDFMWATYPENEINDVVVYDSKGNFITQHSWDVSLHGSIFYKSMWFYCKSLINDGIKPNGLVIGTHDGEFGEWVPLVKNYMSEVVLVEGSNSQYNKLVQNFKRFREIKTINSIITPNGGEVEFFEGGKGYTNSVVERVIRSWEKEEINSTKKNSISINSLIDSEFSQLGKTLDWLHLDVEGLDVQLLISLKKEYIPNFIIFEDYNLSNEDRELIEKWVNENNFHRISEAGISMLSKNK